MEILFTGTGSAFCLKNYQSNALITQNGKHMLFDAGSDIRFALRDRNLSFMDIEAVYISHLHNDHIGGLEYLALESYFKNPPRRIRLFIHKSMAIELWEHSLRAGLCMVSHGPLNLNNYFEVFPLEDEFEWEGLNCRLVKTAHIASTTDRLPVYGLMVGLPDVMPVYFTADTRYLPETLSQSYNRAAIIIQDTETTTQKSRIHAHFDDLVYLPADIKAKMYLWHYQDNVVDDFEAWQAKAKENGFAGFLSKGDCIRL